MDLVQEFIPMYDIGPKTTPGCQTRNNLIRSHSGWSQIQLVQLVCSDLGTDINQAFRLDSISSSKNLSVNHCNSVAT